MDPKVVLRLDEASNIGMQMNGVVKNRKGHQGFVWCQPKIQPMSHCETLPFLNIFTGYDVSSMIGFAKTVHGSHNFLKATTTFTAITDLSSVMLSCLPMRYMKHPVLTACAVRTVQHNLSVKQGSWCLLMASNSSQLYLIDPKSSSNMPSVLHSRIPESSPYQEKPEILNTCDWDWEWNTRTNNYLSDICKASSILFH